MTSLTRDPLLAIAKGLLLFLIVTIGVAAVACLIAAPAIFLAKGYITIELGKELPGVTPAQATAAIVALALLAAVLLGLVVVTLRLLKRIVDTVGEGDPFVPANALRLTRMAWLVLGIQLVSIPMGAIGAWLDHASKDADINIDAGVSGNGLLLMLVLFILARVFRQGAAMRAELEGTV